LQPIESFWNGVRTYIGNDKKRNYIRAKKNAPASLP
jgi:hypothetical protein